MNNQGQVIKIVLKSVYEKDPKGNDKKTKIIFRRLARERDRVNEDDGLVFLSPPPALSKIPLSSSCP